MNFSSQTFAKITTTLPKIGGLVLGCVEADFCVYLFILQHFSSCARFARFSIWESNFCAAPNSNKTNTCFETSDCGEISANIFKIS